MSVTAVTVEICDRVFSARIILLQTLRYVIFFSRS